MRYDIVSISELVFSSLSNNSIFWQTYIFVHYQTPLESQTEGLIKISFVSKYTFRIAAHRVVLYGANDYFKAMFSTGLKERNQPEITITEVEGDILEQLIKYCYTGTIAINNTNINAMTKIANMMQFTSVRDHCASFFSANLTISNCIAIRKIADFHNMILLKEAVHGFLLDHFVEVSNGDEFLQTDIEQLAGLLSADELNVPSEEFVFNALFRWAKYDIEGRKQPFQSLLECIRFKHIKESVR